MTYKISQIKFHKSKPGPGAWDSWSIPGRPDAEIVETYRRGYYELADDCGNVEGPYKGLRRAKVALIAALDRMY